jgi:NADPH-dependent 2,4-dienoyl-CoA reductase/sulfur reductase-like enzyme/predicted acylesterase/phospholipase RssA
MAPYEVDFLLLGGGAASAVAAATLRCEGATGSILIVSAEAVPPYFRPQLSKQYLLGVPGESLRPMYAPGFYQEQAIQLALNTRATSLDTAKKLLTTSDGREIQYGQLLIATGGRPKRLGVPGADLPGIHYLRNKEDCEAVQGAASRATRAVVIGGSFLGIEIAMSLIELGLGVTVIEEGGTILPHLESPILSDFFRHQAEEKGVSVVTHDTVMAFHGRHRVEEVETRSGLRLPCDLVVISIGVGPAAEFLEGSGIVREKEEGWIVVDELLRTSDPNVFAAGDVVDFYDPVFGQRRHIEHWDNAIKQGRLAAKNMLGRRLRYDEISYFFCEIGDIIFDVLGMPEGADERISRGTLDPLSFALFYLKDDVPRALFSVGRPVDETRLAEGLIRYRVNMLTLKDALKDPDYPLDRIPTQTVLILQGGGAMGAFECGVVKALEEERIFSDIVAGISIGALNGAIIAGNPRHATPALESFWSELAVTTPRVPFQEMRRAAVATNILMFGVPRFFRPRWMPPFDAMFQPPWNWTSYYDASPVKELISKYVDFSKLKESPVRLLVGAVNVATAELEVFDSYVDELTPDHILASGSLPPGFSWTIVNGKAYWDGGIVSNSPLDMVIDRCGPDGKRVFIVDLFSGEKPLPTNMMEILARRDEIVYAERVHNDLRTRELVNAYRGLIDEILGQVEPGALAKIKHRPRYIQLMGNGARTSITRFVRAGPADETSARDYDFSEEAIRFNQTEGYNVVKQVLAPAAPAPAEEKPPPRSEAVSMSGTAAAAERALVPEPTPGQETD